MEGAESLAPLVSWHPSPSIPASGWAGLVQQLKLRNSTVLVPWDWAPESQAWPAGSQCSGREGSRALGAGNPESRGEFAGLQRSPAEAATGCGTVMCTAQHGARVAT